MKSSGFSEKGGPSILNESITFWNDFQDLGSPGERKKREKTASTNDHFLRWEKTTETIFCDFKVFFGVIFGTLLAYFGST